MFVAVKTTGIYCRPICPARTPRRENVVFYRSAAAAQEAGFRPCLRCRPEIAALWRGTENTVSRGLQLIDRGALDSDDVAGLAERLGVGERQLRRLFQQHLGASPVAVAQTRRVLIAKQLIHDTRLPMTEVALAAGFGSLRRFHEKLQQLYGRAPRSLRRSKLPDAAHTLTGEVPVRLPLRAPYDWDAMLAFLAARAIPGVESVGAHGYARSIELEGAYGMVQVAPGKGAYANVVVRFPHLIALPSILARVRSLFDVMADPVTIGAQLSAADPRLAKLVRARPGLRVPGSWDGFELAVRAILGQQISVAAARSHAAALAERHGVPMQDARARELGITQVFPAAARLATADLSHLRMPRARSRALSALAAALVGAPDLLSHASSLRALPGIGEWTAQYIAMRHLREPDAFPAGDVALLRALADPHGQRPSAAAMLARAERWRPWRAYAAVHLWTSLGKDSP